jgi:hypothetical protein
MNCTGVNPLQLLHEAIDFLRRRATLSRERYRISDDHFAYVILTYQLRDSFQVGPKIRPFDHGYGQSKRGARIGHRDTDSFRADVQGENRLSRA